MTNISFKHPSDLNASRITSNDLSREKSMKNEIKARTFFKSVTRPGWSQNSRFEEGLLRWGKARFEKVKQSIRKILEDNSFFYFFKVS